MLATAIIVFREVLEAALIVSIVMAACKGLAGRNLWVGSGIAAGVLGASLVAAFAGSLAAMAAGMGQELFNATLLFAAVAMLGWHHVWMARHGRELAVQITDVSQAIRAGTQPLYALAVVTGVAVLREGSETVLFLYGIARSGGADSAVAMAMGGLLGMSAGVGAGVGLYFGLLRIPLRHLFTVTNGMILLLAAGMASQAVGFLVQADVLPPLGPMVWDTSWMLTEGSILGKVLHTLVGYVSRPAGIQVLFYVATLILIGGLKQRFGKHVPAPKTLPPARTHTAAALLVVGLGTLGGAPGAHADDFQVRSPIVDYHEFEFEHNGAVTFDQKHSDLNHNQSYTYAVGAGVTSFWLLEVEGETEASSETTLHYSATTLENTFQLTPQGKYWADLGFFVEYSQSARRNEPNAIEFGPIVQKEAPGFLNSGTLHTLNVFFEKELGHNRSDDTGFTYAWQSRLRLNSLFEPGVELYGDIDDIAKPGTLSEQQHRIGPMFAGLYNLAPYGKIYYEVGYLFGLTRATATGTVRWLFEYEIPF
jgi:high-affinity iron transporter